MSVKRWQKFHLLRQEKRDNAPARALTQITFVFGIIEDESYFP